MMQIVNILLDLVLIGLLGAGISYAIKLTGQLADMRKHRSEMERFVAAFNATVDRAEAGIRGLKSAARSSGDDLEKLIDKGTSLRDELMFLAESADQIATRLSHSAGAAAREQLAAVEEKIEKQTSAPKSAAATVSPITPAAAAPPMKVASNAERDLLRALGKKG